MSNVSSCDNKTTCTNRLGYAIICLQTSVQCITLVINARLVEFSYSRGFPILVVDAVYDRCTRPILSTI
jgi:hypothetical protein